MAATRRLYQSTARAIAARRASGSSEWACDDIALDLAGIFAEENPRFDRGRFLAACGVEWAAAVVQALEGSAA